MIAFRPTKLSALLAVAAISTTAGAQSVTFPRSEMSLIFPARLAANTHDFLAANTSTTAVTLPLAAQPAASVEKTELITESIQSDTWGVLSLKSSSADNTADDADGDNSGRSEPGFFSSSMGRASMIGIAGLAGASYFALRGGSSRNNESSSFSAPLSSTSLPGGTLSPAADVVPEPASLALMAFGLGALAVAAQRRRPS